VLEHVRFRSIGPALMSGRISDVAVPTPAHAGERAAKIFYVAAAGGGVWKTTNGGVTYAPIFDDQRVSSIGAVAVAPSNADIVWVGTGESNNLRSSSWGDGIYKSVDAGATWTHMGLLQSQHIARIVVHPTNADIVFVAAMGPLWSGGGERGFYKTTDGGRHVAEHALSGAVHGRDGHRPGPAQPRRDLRDDVPARPARVQLRGRRPGVGHLEEHGRRRELDASDGGPADGRHGPHRPGRVAEPPAYALRHGGRGA
jgi:hypothetical protein